jgi:quercetin dioxygenase-like cupin family protein
MDTSALPEVSATLLDEARTHSAHRAARTLCGGTGHALRQTAIALLAGSTLSEHENPGEATLQVLVGRVQLSWSDGVVDLDTGEHVVIPQERHGVLARTDAVVLLTAAKH